METVCRASSSGAPVRQVDDMPRPDRMDKDAEHVWPVATRQPPASTAVAEKPIEPMALLRRLVELMGAIPWVTLGAIGTGCGLSLLYFYFRSIEFVPADIPAMLGASLFVGLLATALYLYTAGSLLAPLWAYREAGLDDQTDSNRPSSLWTLQLVGAGAFLLFIGYRLWRDCKNHPEFTLIPGVVLVVIGGLGWGWYQIRQTTHQHPWWRRQLSALNVCFFGVFPFLALFAVLYPSQGADWWHLGLFVAVWLVVVLASSLLFHRIPLWGCALLVMVVTPLFVVSLPGLQGRISYLPTVAAEMAGIRAKQINELRVPEGTCRLIQSALTSTSSARPVNCKEGADWSTVHAQVLSNLGERWLIELQLDGSQPKGRNGAVRVTIPGEGVHTVRQIPAQSSEEAAGCRAR